MLESLSLSKAARFARSFTGQVAMSIAVSAAVAGVLAVPELLLGRPQAPAEAGAAAEIAGVVAIAAPAYLEGVDGKFADRHRAALDEAGGGRRREAGLITPASLVMPMSVSWQQPAQPEPLGQTAPEPRLLTVATDTLPPRRPAALAEPPKLAAQATPLQITPPATAFAPQTAEAPSAAPGLLSRVVVRPVVRVSEAVSGAAGAVGSAGSWTVSQVAGLLPRW